MKRNEVLRYKVNKITIKYVVTSNMHLVRGTRVLHSVMYNIIFLLFCRIFDIDQFLYKMRVTFIVCFKAMWSIPMHLLAMNV